MTTPSWPIASDVRSVPVFIYGLADPVTGEIRYVGKSANPKGRVGSHGARSGARQVREWIASLRTKPALVILLRVEPGQDASVAERCLIGEHDRDGRLLNFYGARGDLSRVANREAARLRRVERNAELLRNYRIARKRAA